MKPRTQEHLDLAGDNLALGQLLLQRGLGGLTRPPTLEWAALAAFYAAGNYLDAYLNETKSVDPKTLKERLNTLGADPVLMQGWPISTLGAYLRLRQLHTVHNWYPPQGRPAALRVSPTTADEAVNRLLAMVATTVCGALGIASPA